MTHSPRASRSRSFWRRYSSVRFALATGLAVCAVAGGFWWNQQRIAPQPTQASVAGSTLSGFTEADIRDEQIRVWNIALEADTGSSLVLGQLAAYHMQRAREGGGWSDYLEAERLARHSLENREQRNGATFVTLANSLLAQHRFTEARDVVDRLVEREYDIPEYRALRGEVAMELGDDLVADSMFRSVWEQRTELSMAPRVARWLELTNHVRDARKLMERARDAAISRRIVTNETKAWFQMRVGDLELRAGNYRRAEQAYRAGLDIEPGDPRLFSAMARLAIARNKPADAIAWGERAIGMDLDPATLGLLGDAHAALGDSTKAAEYFHVLQVAVADQPGAYHRAWALYLLDHGLQVDTVLAKATDELAERRDVYGYDLMAWALYKSGRIADAKRMMAQAMRFDTPDPLLQHHASVIARASAPTFGAR